GANRAAGGDVGGKAPRPDHSAQYEIGAVILGAGAFDQLERGNAGMGGEHGAQGGGAALVRSADQRGAGAVQHAERAVGRDAVREGGGGGGEEAVGAWRGAVGGIFLGEFLD